MGDKQEQKYEELKKSILEIVKKNPNDAILGNKMRLFIASLSEDVILKNEEIESKYQF